MNLTLSKNFIIGICLTLLVGAGCKQSWGLDASHEVTSDSAPTLIDVQPTTTAGANNTTTTRPAATGAAVSSSSKTATKPTVLATKVSVTTSVAVKTESVQPKKLLSAEDDSLVQYLLKEFYYMPKVTIEGYGLGTDSINKVTPDVSGNGYYVGTFHMYNMSPSDSYLTSFSFADTGQKQIIPNTEIIYYLYGKRGASYSLPRLLIATNVGAPVFKNFAPFFFESPVTESRSEIFLSVVAKRRVVKNPSVPAEQVIIDDSKEQYHILLNSYNDAVFMIKEKDLQIFKDPTTGQTPAEQYFSMSQGRRADMSPGVYNVSDN